ncbi:MAG TPA: electron transfer flavoprotein subunit alpha/FixB family protein [Blastocatellia bacterium]|jgi:electron transfer flavoprotein alpha subunit|nr:electron transfer flavoprotein subunit alpha/FixB family protein [Blastocatellia bacterium]HAF24244.1 electron transfer flavoprotein subunit alpha/FixB family protein [Blastocatellia bacterium]
MSSGILVFIEHRNGVLNKTSLEAIAAAQSLASSLQQPVTAVLLGDDVSALSQEIAGYDLAKIVTATNAKLADYTPDGYSDAMELVIRQLDPQLVVMPHTYLVRDYAPKLAARFGKSLISDCIRAQGSGSSITFTRRIFLGKLDADVVSDGAAPVFATFQSGAYRPDQAQKGSGAAIEAMPVEVGQIRMTPEAPFQEVKQAVDLSKADIIVAVGRGIKSKDNLALAEKLAEVLGGDLAASRPICDAEWLPIDRQIGSSGQTVAPKLYVALGISGAIQHLVGMKNSGTIVAINKDPEAPIFDIADYGIVGDLFEAVPVLTEEIKKIKGLS